MLISFEASSFIALAEHAIEVCRDKKHTRIVCGPITSGGRGDIRANVEVFCAVVMGLQAELSPLCSTGQQVLFNQMAYEKELWRLLHIWKRENPDRNGYNPILEEFYQPIFATGIFEFVHFIPGWETSRGARWERAYFERQLGVHALGDISYADVERYLKRWRGNPKSRSIINRMLARQEDALPAI